MKKDIKDLEEAQGYTGAEIADLKSNLTESNQAQEKLKDNLEEKIAQSSNKAHAYAKKQSASFDDRKRNLLFLGVNEGINIDIRYIVCGIISNTQIKLDPKEIDNAVRVGPFRVLNRPRLIQVSFVSTYTRN